MPIQPHEARNPITKTWNILNVLIENKHISDYLASHDPRALEQYKDALASLRPLFEVDRQCIHCGHSDTVQCVSDNPGMYGSAFSYCTDCDRPWDTESVDCHHCGTEGDDGN